jgi:hypothetical protein
MAGTLSVRTVLAAIGAVACVAVAVGVALHVLRGPSRDLEQRPAPPEVTQRIEAITSELVGLSGAARAKRLGELMSPDAPPRAAEAVGLQIEGFRRAASWKLVAADAYGPTLLKAIYDLADRNGQTRQAALIFERTADGVVLLDIAR